MSILDTEQINIDLLREDIRKPVKTFVSQLVNDLAENLKSISVVGSALTEDFHPRRSDINTVVVVERESHTLLRTLAGYGNQMGKLRLKAPLLVMNEFIQQSLDVFGVEYLEYQFNHVTVCGHDPFAGLSFSKENVRLQCERELRSIQIQLRQGYIRGLGQYKIVGPLLIACGRKLLPLFRAMLWLMDIDRAKDTRTMLELAGMGFGFDEKLMGTLLSLRKQEERLGPDLVDLMFQDVYKIVVHLCGLVDKLRTKA